MPAECDIKILLFLTACIETSAFSMRYGRVTICFAKLQQNLQNQGNRATYQESVAFKLCNEKKTMNKWVLTVSIQVAFSTSLGLDLT
jgi:hypothetical protein